MDDFEPDVISKTWKCFRVEKFNNDCVGFGLWIMLGIPFENTLLMIGFDFMMRGYRLEILR